MYLHVFDWPKDGRLNVPGLKTMPAAVWLLKDGPGVPLPVRRGKTGMTFDVPGDAPESCVSVVAADFEAMPAIEQAEIDAVEDATAQAAT